MFSNHQTKGLLALVLTTALLSTGCSWDKLEIPEPPEVVSFSADIIPIFNTSCNAVGCHAANGISPNLSVASAYADLFNKGLVDTADPSASDLYSRMNSSSAPMPPQGKLNQYQVDLVLAWIEQGAIDN